MFGCVAIPDNQNDLEKHRLSHKHLVHLKPLLNRKPLSICHGETSVNRIPIRFGDVLSVRYSTGVGVFVFAKLCNEFVKWVSETRDAYLKLLKVESSYISLEEFFSKLYSHLSLSSIDLDRSKYTEIQLIDFARSPTYINHVSITSIPARNSTCAFYGKDAGLLLERVLKAYHVCNNKCHRSIKRDILSDVEKLSNGLNLTYDSPIDCANVLLADRLRSELDASYKSKTEQDYKKLGLDCSFLNATADLKMSGMQHGSLHSSPAQNLQLYTLSDEQLRRLLGSRDCGNDAYIPRNNFQESLPRSHKTVTAQDVEEIVSKSLQRFNETETEPPRKKQRTEQCNDILATEQVKRLIDSLEMRVSKPTENSELLIKTLNDKTERMSKALDEQSQVLASLQEQIVNTSSDRSTDKRLDCSSDSIEVMKRAVVSKVIQKCKE